MLEGSKPGGQNEKDLRCVVDCVHSNCSNCRLGVLRQRRRRSSRSSGGPLSDVQLSQANHPIQMLAQAGPTDTNPLVSDGLLKPVTGSADPDAAGATSDDKPKPKPTPTPKPTRTPVPGCKNGRAVGNKHCIPSPSE